MVERVSIAFTLLTLIRTATQSCFVVFCWKNGRRGNAETWSQRYTTVHWLPDRTRLDADR